MKKLTYPIEKKEKLMVFLFILLPLSSILLFSFDKRFNEMFSVVYDYRYASYFFCFFACLLVLFKNSLLFSVKIDDKKIIIKFPLHRINKEVFLDSVIKLKITKLGIWILEIKKEFFIPFEVYNFLAKKDFLYIINLFKNLETEYDEITQKEVLELLSNRRNSRKNLLEIIICIGLIFILSINLFFSFLFILALIF